MYKRPHLGALQASDEFSLIFETNPIAEFVELPDSQAGLKYSNILCGTIRCGQLVQHPVCPGAPWRWCTWRSPPGSPRITSRSSSPPCPPIGVLCHGMSCLPPPLTPSPLQGDNVTELRVKFLRKIEDTVPAGDD